VLRQPRKIPARDFLSSPPLAHKTVGFLIASLRFCFLLSGAVPHRRLPKVSTRKTCAHNRSARMTLVRTELTYSAGFKLGKGKADLSVDISDVGV
jgi:hypothetical protein